MDVNSSGEPTRLLGENVWGEFLYLKHSTESIIKGIDSEEPSRQLIKELSIKHLSIKRCHSTIMRIMSEYARLLTNEFRSSRYYEEAKYIVKEITTLLLETRNSRDAAIDMFVINSTHNPTLCVEEVEQFEEPVQEFIVVKAPTRTPIVVTATQTAAILTAKVNAVSIKEEPTAQPTQQQRHQQDLDLTEEGTTENLNVKCLDIHCVNTDFFVLQLLMQEQMDLGIVTALQSPFDRGKRVIANILPMEHFENELDYQLLIAL